MPKPSHAHACPPSTQASNWITNGLLARLASIEKSWLGLTQLLPAALAISIALPLLCWVDQSPPGAEVV